MGPLPIVARLGLAVLAAGLVLAVAGVIDLRDQDEVDSIAAAVYAVVPPVTEAPVPATSPTPSVAVTPAATGPVASVTQLARPDRSAPITDPPAPPVPVPGDCASWRAVFAYYGATPLELEFFFGDARPWRVPRRNIIWGESSCGLDFINERTSDRYVCMLNGVHAEPGYAFGTYYGPGGWLLELFGLRGGRQVTTQAEASTVAAVPACLWLLRGGGLPDSFAGARAWRPV